MSYLKHVKGCVTHLIDLDCIRHVKCVTANPAGGAPRSDSARILYLDGYVLEVSLECGLAVQDALKGDTVQSKQPK